MAEIGSNIKKAKLLLDNGKLVSIPTETVYGLAGNALNSNAVALIFKTKNRPSFDPLILHIKNIASLDNYVSYVPKKAKILMERLWPGPLTFLSPKKSIIPDLVTSGMPRVAVRIPNNPLTLDLLNSIDFPLVAPSANPFGYVSPTSAQHVDKQLGNKIEYILDGGKCEIGIESTIIGFENEELPTIHRLGGISKEKIESLIGKVSVQAHSTSNPKAPGMLKSHYSPGKKLIIGDLLKLQEKYKGKRLGVISFQKKLNDIEMDNQQILSPSGNLSEAAQNLFSALRGLDKKDIDIIITEAVPDHGLGRAINDRLKRAAAK